MELVSRAFLVKVYEEQGLSDLATSHCLEIGRQTPWEQSQEAKPLYMPHPKYPRDALANSRAGSVVIDFEISEMGFAQNIKIRDSGGNSIFREAAITALKDARFAPKFENGKPVAANSSYRFGFTIVR